MSYDDEHTVTLSWEPFCADAETGDCDDPDCDPDVDGEWMAACNVCDFLVMAPESRRADLWAFAERHEKADLGIERLPAQ
ncbi:hypothetical protein [Sphaerisporangium sp. NPDC051011]|uniref:hypothetical protein n=1 Tax=Sphaerisporangium sp. NPDC051011 TaxID=3155792 RepID=UPI0033F1459C